MEAIAPPPATMDTTLVQKHVDASPSSASPTITSNTSQAGLTNDSMSQLDSAGTSRRTSPGAAGTTTTEKATESRQESPDPTAPEGVAVKQTSGNASHDAQTKEILAAKDQEIANLRAAMEQLNTQLGESRNKNVTLTRQITIMERELATFRRLRPIAVSIPRYHTHREGYTVYEIKIDKGVVSYSVRHRYSDFRKLQELAKKECKHAPLPALPARSGFMGGSTSGDIEKLETRRRELETYLRQFVAVTELRDSSVFASFAQPNSADMRGALVDDDALVMMSGHDLDHARYAAVKRRNTDY